MSKVTKLVLEAREAYEKCVERMDETDSRIQALDDEAPKEERELLEAIFEQQRDETARAKQVWERQVAIDKARRDIPPVRSNDGGDGDDGDGGDGDDGASRSPSARRARIAVGKEPLVYEPNSPHSYFRDLVFAEVKRDVDAAARLKRHGAQVAVHRRDVTTADPGAASFIPPLYMGDQYIDKAVAGRPFADAIPKIPLSGTGKNMDFPRVATAPNVDVQAAEANAVNETDFDGETYSVSKVTIAGQNDVSIQALEFSDPSIDTVIMRELIKSYNQKLDYQLIYGSGSSGQHRGIKTVVVSDGGQAITFSAGGADDLLGKVYQAVADIPTNVPGYEAQTVLAHPRRLAWMASHRDANGNLFQQGQLFLAAGEQDQGFVGNVAGLRVIKDSNILTNQGSGTNEDDVYAMDITELMLAEGEQRTRVLQEVLSGTLQVRIQLYAFSAFAGGRRPGVIARISGAGLATPTFPST